MKPLKFAVIQSGHAVFGVGTTRLGALRDATRCLNVDAGSNFERYTVRMIEEHLLSVQRVDGAFRVIDSNDSEFDSYLEAQGGFTKKRKNWYVKR